MRILVHSSSLECNSGYGNVTYEIVTRLKAMGHFVRIATKHMYPVWQRWVDWEEVATLSEKALESKSIEGKDGYLSQIQDELVGVEIFEGTNISIINEMIEEENFDCIFTLWDIWKLYQKTHPPHNKWIAYVPIDTEWICDSLRDVCTGKDIKNSDKPRGPLEVVAMSLHGVRELNSCGLLPQYAPHGINTWLFRPKPEGRKAFRDDFGFGDDIFLIGSVGLNYGDDRKGFIPLLRAFKVFHERHPEARLYIHSHAEGKYPGTVEYISIVNKLGLERLVYWPHQASNDIGRIGGEWLCDTYNGFDVYCSPNRGEGFGLCVPEAAACGIPTITTDTTTGAEFHRAGIVEWLIPVSDSDLRYIPGTFRHEVGQGPILEALEKAHSAWKSSDYQKLKDNARQNALAYDWRVVWKKWWVPLWEKIEKRLKYQAEADTSDPNACEHDWIDVSSRDSGPGKTMKCMKCGQEKREPIITS